jgi:hypothetical protein
MLLVVEMDLCLLVSLYNMSFATQNAWQGLSLLALTVLAPKVSKHTKK